MRGVARARSQWQSEIRKCVGSRLRVHVHHMGATQKVFNRDLDELTAADVVLTTYEALRVEAPWKHLERYLLRVHWWRVATSPARPTRP